MNLNILLMTSTKGHFDRRDIYQRTLASIITHLGYSSVKTFIHVKISPGENQAWLDMAEFIQKFDENIEVFSTYGSWQHMNQSHQSQYIKDIRTMANVVNIMGNEYTLFLEDDWLLESQAEKSSVYNWVLESVELLWRKPDLVQVRIPRFTNEFERINRLQAKHGIPAHATKVVNGTGLEDFYFTCNDWSNNPFICRTRDLYIAMMLMEKNPNAFPNHAEHGFGRAMRYLSLSEECLAVIRPDLCRAFHIGTKEGEEDKLDQPLNSD